MHYVNSIDQFSLNSSISERTRCQYGNSSVGWRWICHCMIHRYLSCPLPHSHVGGTGQLWTTPLGSVILQSRSAASVSITSVSVRLSFKWGLCTESESECSDWIQRTFEEPLKPFRQRFLVSSVYTKRKASSQRREQTLPRFFLNM